MEKYKIEYITRDFEPSVYQPAEDGKTNFLDNNNSMNICTVMILGKNKNEIETYHNFHRIFYGRYIGGFAFEGSRFLPPLCILQSVEGCENTANNAVYYNGTVYDPKLGVFSISEYEKQNLSILSYVQMFIPEAYEGTDWKPLIPEEIQAAFEKDTELAAFFHSLPLMQQSKILNYIHPFSKPSSFKENRTLSKPITPTKIQHVISHIKSFMSISNSAKSPWEELKEFETVEAVETLKKCGLAESMIVLDMGCGHGHYTYAASIAAGTNGKVIAVDMDKNALKHTENRAGEYGLQNIVFIKTNEKGLSEYKESIDFIILYDVLHGLFNHTKAGWGITTKLEFIDSLVSLLKNDGIFSLALFSEIESNKVPEKTKNGKETFKSVPIPHEEAVQPYIELMQTSGLKLHNIIENGGVHFDDFHNPTKWRKYGEIKVSSLERRNIYNFVKNHPVIY